MSSIRPHTQALPVAVLEKLPAELRDARSGRSVVATDAGWLVAVNGGEFGGGLFAVDPGATKAMRLDAQLPEAIRWIAKFNFGIVGVAGLCHGEGCIRNTWIYRINRSQGHWRPHLLAELSGCPTSVQSGAGEDEMLVTTCGALHGVTATGVDVLATWDKMLHAGWWRGAAARDAKGTSYVSFSRVIGRFKAGADPEWFVPSACLEPEQGQSAECTCTATAQSNDDAP